MLLGAYLPWNTNFYIPSSQFVESLTSLSGQLAHSDNTQHVSNNNWHMDGQILDGIFVFLHLGINV